jgi:hypothetical protein
MSAGGDHDEQRQALGVDDQVPLAAVDFLAPAVAAGVLADGLGGFDRLRVDDGATAPGALPISRRMRLRSWSRICPTMPAAAQRAMNP